MSEGTDTQFGPDDDGLHTAVMSDDWWETETAWFSFHHPGRRLGGWLYTMIRPNIGTVAGGAWVWDDTASLPWDVLYSANYSALPLPARADLRNLRLPTGVSIRVVEPTRSYELGYDDGDALQLALRFDGVMAPEPLVAPGSTFGSARHFDQLGHVTGSILVDGDRIAIDCLAMRDRTWGRRPEHRPRQAAYVTGAANATHGFLAVTNTRGDDDRVAYGFLLRDGRTAGLTGGRRTVVRSRKHGWVVRVLIDATDAAGRELHAAGEVMSRIVINRHTFIDINGLVSWDIDGDAGWGEDQDMWPVHTFAAYRRRQRARDLLDGAGGEDDAETA
jgi:hypothetical protein